MRNIRKQGKKHLQSPKSCERAPSGTLCEYNCLLSGWHEGVVHFAQCESAHNSNFNMIQSDARHERVGTPQSRPLFSLCGGGSYIPTIMAVYMVFPFQEEAYTSQQQQYTNHRGICYLGRHVLRLRSFHCCCSVGGLPVYFPYIV